MVMMKVSFTTTIVAHEKLGVTVPKTPLCGGKNSVFSSLVLSENRLSASQRTAQPTRSDMKEDGRYIQSSQTSVIAASIYDNKISLSVGFVSILWS